jgi:hypothetical protein
LTEKESSAGRGRVDLPGWWLYRTGLVSKGEHLGTMDPFSVVQYGDEEREQD